MCDLKTLDEIVPAIKNGKCVFWIGSGLSCIAGCKSWESLIKEMLSAPFMSLKRSKFKDTPLPEILSICYEKFNGAQHRAAYKAIIQNTISYNATKFERDYEPIIKALVSIGPRISFITTNIDSCLERTFNFTDKNRFHENDDLRVENISKGAVFHLHGIAEQFEEGAWKSEEYKVRYAKKSYLDFLKGIANKYSVIFIGSGLNETEVMQFFDKNSGSNHYALFDSKEWNRELFERWDRRNIKLINYGDKKNLGRILISWVNKNFTKTINLENPEEDPRHAK